MYSVFRGQDYQIKPRLTKKEKNLFFFNAKKSAIFLLKNAVS